MANHSDRMDKQLEAETLLDTYVVGQDAQVDLWNISSEPEAARPEWDKAEPSSRTDWRDAVGLAYSGEDREEVLRLMTLDHGTRPDGRPLDTTYPYGRIRIYNLLGMHTEAVQEARSEEADPRNPLSMNWKIRHQCLAGDQEGALETAQSILNPLDRAIAFGKLGEQKLAQDVCEANGLTSKEAIHAVPKYLLPILVEALMAGGKREAAEGIADHIVESAQRAEAFILTGNKEKARAAIQELSDGGSAVANIVHVISTVLRYSRDPKLVQKAVAETFDEVMPEVTGSDEQGRGTTLVDWGWVKANLFLKNGDTESALGMIPQIDDPFRKAEVYRRAGRIGEALGIVRGLANADDFDKGFRASEFTRLGQWREALLATREDRGRGTRSMHLRGLIEAIDLPGLTQKLHALPRNQRRYLTWKHARDPERADAMTALGRTCDNGELHADIRKVGEDTVGRIAAALNGALEGAPEARHIVAVHQRPLRHILAPEV